MQGNRLDEKGVSSRGWLTVFLTGRRLWRIEHNGRMRGRQRRCQQHIANGTFRPGRRSTPHPLRWSAQPMRLLYACERN